MAETEVVLLTNGLCAKSRAIRERSAALGVDPKVIDIATEPKAAAVYGPLFGDGKPHHQALSLASVLGAIRQLTSLKSCSCVLNCWSVGQFTTPSNNASSGT